ncbi:hypothetical protein [Polaribacter marinivivus]|uniref:Uncharacterized protein n=1 Tax=Polaribacter marinivivus TaxID=1524260 RepID=A0ABV8R7H0_9FLAO|nr:hypothetical protein [uncultured Polaribacter sp.]
MNKIAQYPRLVFVFFFVFIYLITYLSGIENAMLRTVFSITLAFVISPRRKKLKTQTGEKTQVTWIFLKKPIILE